MLDVNLGSDVNSGVLTPSFCVSLCTAGSRVQGLPRAALWPAPGGARQRTPNDHTRARNVNRNRTAANSKGTCDTRSGPVICQRVRQSPTQLAAIRSTTTLGQLRPCVPRAMERMRVWKLPSCALAHSSQAPAQRTTFPAKTSAGPTSPAPPRVGARSSQACASCGAAATAAVRPSATWCTHHPATHVPRRSCPSRDARAHSAKPGGRSLVDNTCPWCRWRQLRLRGRDGAGWRGARSGRRAEQARGVAQREQRRRA